MFSTSRTRSQPPLLPEEMKMKTLRPSTVNSLYVLLQQDAVLSLFL